MRLCIMAILFCGLCAFAGESQVIIDFKSKTPAEMTLKAGESTEQINISSKSKDFIRCYGKTPLDDSWQKYTVTFTPDKDGYVTLALRGPFVKSGDGYKKIWVAYDDITVKNGKLGNGDFSQVNALGKFSDWHSVKENVVKDHKQAKKGKYYAKVCATMAMVKSLKVYAGKEVTLTVYAKAAK